jgi:threonine dehydrogenase-like Zn-dependent dehydrogenase
MAGTSPLPSAMKALVLNSTSEPPTVKTVPTPQLQMGSAIVRVLSANTISYIRDIYNGKRQYPFPTPLIPGSSAIGRIASVALDATKFKPGDLVFVDCVVRSRDQPTDTVLAAIAESGTPGSAKLFREVWRDWTYAEYCRVPLEGLVAINEKALLGSPTNGGLGYRIEDLGYVAALCVPYGGLRDIDLKPGQTIVVAPATGPFGGAAVLVALAMGAKVIAMGRNKDSLATLKKKVPNNDRVSTVPITGDMAADLAALQSHGEIDAAFDIGPREAAQSTHLQSMILSLRHGGRISLMGGYHQDMPIPHRAVMRRNLRLQGKWMCERSDVVDLLKLIESGLLKLGEKGGAEVTGAFPLEQWKEAWDMAAEKALFGQFAMINP